ncbi:NAD(P)-binding protein [Gymnopus androsaceus JB14]|uniref:NAD(P)-binding protein n=1 Tax=Gymnopus androsaceus JB14 TaxID=1447944 RepID=A0A6A4HSU1_9AGAR|nr:NAD(P)-binding protein [Gymnopus androsaceus JB14]
MTAKSLGVALVTGASQGIGKVIAARLASDGFKHALNDVATKREQLGSLAEEIEKKFGHGACVVFGDVRKEEDVERMVESASKTLGGLDVMVANAAVVDWDNALGINAKGTFLCYKYAALEMIKQGRPDSRRQNNWRIFACRKARHNASRYICRVKARCTRFDTDCGPYRESNINERGTNTVALELLNMMPSFSEMGQPEDIASVVSYLASKEPHYITDIRQRWNIQLSFSLNACPVLLNPQSAINSTSRLRISRFGLWE